MKMNDHKLGIKSKDKMNFRERKSVLQIKVTSMYNYRLYLHISISLHSHPPPVSLFFFLKYKYHMSSDIHLKSYNAQYPSHTIQKPNSIDQKCSKGTYTQSFHHTVHL
jgi:hypothetical protein